MNPDNLKASTVENILSYLQISARKPMLGYLNRRKKQMKSLTPEIFRRWLELYGKARRENNAYASAELFSSDARHFEFDEDRKCCLFCEWWHLQAVVVDSSGEPVR